MVAAPRSPLGFDAWPDGFELDVHETADALGLAAGHRNSAFTRTVQRIVQFGMARLGDDGALRAPPPPTAQPAPPQPAARLPPRRPPRLDHRDAETPAREHERAHAAAAGLSPSATNPTSWKATSTPSASTRRIAAQAVAWAQSRIRHPTAHWDGPDAA